VSGYFAFQFRASVNFLDSRNSSEVPQDFSVTLTDGAANSATARVSDWSAALFYPPGRIAPLSPQRPLLPVPKIVLNTARIPFSAFRDATGRMAVNLTDIRTVRFDFDHEPAGALLIADIAFADAVDPQLGQRRGLQGTALARKLDLLGHYGGQPAHRRGRQRLRVLDALQHWGEIRFSRSLDEGLTFQDE
jgi:hypothetical protein